MFTLKNMFIDNELHIDGKASIFQRNHCCIRCIQQLCKYLFLKWKFSFYFSRVATELEILTIVRCKRTVILYLSCFVDILPGIESNLTKATYIKRVNKKALLIRIVSTNTRYLKVKLSVMLLLELFCLWWNEKIPISAAIKRTMIIKF